MNGAELGLAASVFLACAVEAVEAIWRITAIASRISCAPRCQR